MKRYKVVVSDLDGTLLDNKKIISEENRSAIQEMVELGVHFVASTGRCFSELPDEIMNTPSIRYISCSDGAVIYDRKSGEAVVKNYMPMSVVKKCVDILKDYEIVPMTHKDGRLYLDGSKRDHETYLYNNVTAAFEKLMNDKGEPVDDCLEYALDGNAVELMCVFFHSQNELRECVERLLALGEVKVASSEKNNIEVYYKQAGKGNALSCLAALLEIDISEVIAVGDSKNDIEMVTKAGIGLAMKNSMPELISVADAVICSNEEHSAKYILENYIK
ncbi:MAG: HAD family hydrolase [Clostridia bacterium]|nr:HAD family hydrolase [Clostridia bacterium]